jgi:hypothetical protein
MSDRFPNSARTAWLQRNAKHRRVFVSDVEREQRLLVRELSRTLRQASLEQLHQVAQDLGHSPRWIELARIEACRPGQVGIACLRAAK